MASGATDHESPSNPSLVLTVCISQTQANARAIHRLRKQLVWVSVLGAGKGTAALVETVPCVWPRAWDRSEWVRRVLPTGGRGLRLKIKMGKGRKRTAQAPGTRNQT